MVVVGWGRSANIFEDRTEPKFLHSKENMGKDEETAHQDVDDGGEELVS